MSERETLRDALMDSSSDVDTYILQRRKIEEAIVNSFKRGSRRMSDLLDTTIDSATSFLNPNSPVTAAAMHMAALAYRAYLYLDSETPKVSFSQLWQGTHVHKLAEQSEVLAEGIQPITQGHFVNVDLQKHKEAFDNQIANGNPEGIILTGLNGVGKTTVLKSLLKYLDLCGLKTEVLKFPRSNGPLSDTILPILSANKTINASALQYLMIADALDSQITDSDALRVYDRHPIADALVYGPPSTQIPILASREIFQNPNWIIVIDRHPAAAMKGVENRHGNKRIFEQKLEQMVDQVIKFAALTALPGCRWINNDVPSQAGDVSSEWSTEISKRRVVGSLITSGVINRALVRQGIKRTLVSAEDHAYDKFFINMQEWVET